MTGKKIKIGEPEFCELKKIGSRLKIIKIVHIILVQRYLTKFFKIFLVM